MEQLRLVEDRGVYLACFRRIAPIAVGANDETGQRNLPYEEIRWLYRIAEVESMYVILFHT
jgi:hypothetical protein